MGCRKSESSGGVDRWWVFANGSNHEANENQMLVYLN